MMTPKSYKDVLKKVVRPTDSRRNFLCSFLIGGGICAIGEALRLLYIFLGADEENSFIYVSLSLIFLSVSLTSLGIYDKIAAYGGAGTLVPITGFANAMSSAAIEFRSEGFIVGVGAKMFVIAGPVIVYGTVTAMGAGLIYYLLK